MNQIFSNTKQNQVKVQKKNYLRNLRLPQKYLMILIRKFAMIGAADEKEAPETITDPVPNLSNAIARGDKA